MAFLNCGACLPISTSRLQEPINLGARVDSLTTFEIIFLSLESLVKQFIHFCYIQPNLFPSLHLQVLFSFLDFFLHYLIKALPDLLKR